MSAVETIVPESEEHWLKLRSQDITSTEVAALFGLSPYMTPFELWHRKKENLTVQFEANERTRWGLRLQDSIAAGIAEDQGWTIRRMDEYLRNTKLRAGASFDFAVGTDGLLEIKNVDGLVFKNEWAVDGNNIEAPPSIELQVQHQLGLSKRRENHIGALVGGNRLVLIKREPDEKIISAIEKKIEEFWDSIESNKEPKPDFSRDADVIRRIYCRADAGKIFDCRGNPEINDFVAQYQELNHAKKGIETKIDEIKANLIVRMADCEKAIGDNFSISAGIVAEAEIPTYIRKSYRNFRINLKKVKS